MLNNQLSAWSTLGLCFPERSSTRMCCASTQWCGDRPIDKALIENN